MSHPINYFPMKTLLVLCSELITTILVLFRTLQLIHHLINPTLKINFMYDVFPLDCE